MNVISEGSCRECNEMRNICVFRREESKLCGWEESRAMKGRGGRLRKKKKQGEGQEGEGVEGEQRKK